MIVAIFFMTLHSTNQSSENSAQSCKYLVGNFWFLPENNQHILANRDLCKRTATREQFIGPPHDLERCISRPAQDFSGHYSTTPSCSPYFCPSSTARRY